MAPAGNIEGKYSKSFKSLKPPLTLKQAKLPTLMDKLLGCHVHTIIFNDCHNCRNSSTHRRWRNYPKPLEKTRRINAS